MHFYLESIRVCGGWLLGLAKAAHFPRFRAGGSGVSVGGVGFPKGGVGFSVGGIGFPEGGIGFPKGGTGFPEGGRGFPISRGGFPEGGGGFRKAEVERGMGAQHMVSSVCHAFNEEPRRGDL